MLWLLLSIGATYSVDPKTGITEGRDSPEVKQAILNFLRRPDQTTESMSESIRAMAMAQPQNPDVNAELLHLLNSPEPALQVALLNNLPRLTLTREDFESAKAQVAAMARNPGEPSEVQRAADAILPCWTNNRHKGLCPALG